MIFSEFVKVLNKTVVQGNLLGNGCELKVGVIIIDISNIIYKELPKNFKNYFFITKCSNRKYMNKINHQLRFLLHSMVYVELKNYPR